MTTIEDAALSKRILYGSLRSTFNGWLYVSTSRLFGAATRPDIVKKYPCRPNLFATRIYKPAHTTSEKLPLFLTIHGGGFVVNNPAKEDEIARHMANNAKILVASLDYSKAPTNRFPVAYEDIVEVALAVINDPDLPIDRSKVVIGGNSAGGNLALATVQDPRLRPHVLGVLGLYPICDATSFMAEKLSTRPDPSIPDILETSYDDILRMYLGPQQNIDLAEPRLSPGRYKRRDDLPRHVYLIGIEHDLLAAEAKAMAERLAQEESSKKRQTKQGWVAGGVKWDLVEGQTHGFDQFGGAKAKEVRRLEQKDELYRAMVAWLREVVGG